MEKNGHYISIQKSFVERGFLAVMSRKALKVYIALCSFRDWKTGNCWPTLSKLSELTGLHRAYVIKANHELEELGLVKSWLNRKEGNRTFKKFYHINPIEDIGPQNMDTYRKNHSPQKVDTYLKKRDKRGRFQKSESTKRGHTGSTECGRTGSTKRGRELMLLNESQRTSLKKTSLSFIDEEDKKTIEELAQLKGKAFVKSELRKAGRNPKLVDKIEL